MRAALTNIYSSRGLEPVSYTHLAAVAAARERLAGQVDYFKAVQFFFYTQWNARKAYANSKGIQLVGDIPILSLIHI